MKHASTILLMSIFSINASADIFASLAAARLTSAERKILKAFDEAPLHLRSSTAEGLVVVHSSGDKNRLSSIVLNGDRLEVHEMALQGQSADLNNYLNVNFERVLDSGQPVWRTHFREVSSRGHSISRSPKYTEIKIGSESFRLITKETVASSDGRFTMISLPENGEYRQLSISVHKPREEGIELSSALQGSELRDKRQTILRIIPDENSETFRIITVEPASSGQGPAVLRETEFKRRLTTDKEFLLEQANHPGKTRVLSQYEAAQYRINVRQLSGIKTEAISTESLVPKQPTAEDLIIYDGDGNAVD